MILKFKKNQTLTCRDAIADKLEPPRPPRGFQEIPVRFKLDKRQIASLGAIQRRALLCDDLRERERERERGKEAIRFGLGLERDKGRENHAKQRGQSADKHESYIYNIYI
jgi:hypothetical protein